MFDVVRNILKVSIEVRLCRDWIGILGDHQQRLIFSIAHLVAFDVHVVSNRCQQVLIARIISSRDRGHPARSHY